MGDTLGNEPPECMTTGVAFHQKFCVHSGGKRRGCRGTTFSRGRRHRIGGTAFMHTSSVIALVAGDACHLCPLRPTYWTRKGEKFLPIGHVTVENAQGRTLKTPPYHMCAWTSFGIAFHMLSTSIKCPSLNYCSTSDVYNKG